MKKPWFEIVRRTFDRYSWLLVEMRGGRRRVLARAGRDYRSKRKVRAAIDKLRLALPGAEVVDATGSDGDGPFELPGTRFDLVPGVLPLVVDGWPVRYASAVVHRRGARRQDTAEADRERTEDQGPAEDRPRTEEPAEPEQPPTRRRPASQPRKSAAPRGSRASTAV